ncbi:precorrin-3B C(17)-methyltransferase [Candidatus Halocynthiibacter alkanivorans]|uniref:precorrin-3B C(17)-methyltransferase n=1 Tax=Candidatus Halocynthiibacter alkanivorans TaxID=2267619 RepID=UPI000DF37599|nr:precorrin-3B C(17)-methyltransferase [Candidatus Halocynthiibacter alkanivorans]
MAVKPVVLCLSSSGEEVAHKVAAILEAQVHGREGRVEKADAFFPNALEHAQALFAAGTPIVGVCASGILIRAVAPLLGDKRQEPPVVSVSDDGAVVVPLLGGHRGANRIARDVAEALGAVAAVTTAGDVALGVALDEPPRGYGLANPQDAKGAMANLLSGAGLRQRGARLFDIEDRAGKSGPGSKNKGGEVQVELLITEAPVEGNATRLVYHPQHYVLGLGCARNADPEEMWTLVSTVLADADIAPGAVACIATIDLKADEPAMNVVAKRLGVPLRLFTAAELEAHADQLINPSEVVFAEVGCHGVCEGAALACGADLAVPKQKTANVTCAIGRSEKVITEMKGRARGRLSVVGIGPGQATWRTPEVSRLVADAEELVGYGLYIDLLGPLAAGKTRSDFPLGGEEARCRYALEQAAKGKNVALVCSGDAGIYAMGALVFELLDRGVEEHGVSDAAHRVEVVCSPGVSALQGAAARAGAPLGHDFCAISLSDLLTPREDIINRIRMASMGDFIIAFYNPVSKTRRTLLEKARKILLQHRPADTPVMLASSLGRPEEHVRYRELSELDVDEVDMLTVVLIGSSNTRLAQLGEGPRMFTPRGYARKIDGDLSGLAGAGEVADASAESAGGVAAAAAEPASVATGSRDAAADIAADEDRNTNGTSAA